jgi:ribosomal protein L6P/L9E
MLTIPLPPSLRISPHVVGSSTSSVSSSNTTTLYRREGPFGSRTLDLSTLTLTFFATPNGRRLLLSSKSNSSSQPLPLSTVASRLTSIRNDLAYGSRRRLRLVGVGFRVVSGSSVVNPAPSTTKGSKSSNPSLPVKPKTASSTFPTAKALAALPRTGTASKVVATHTTSADSALPLNFKLGYSHDVTLPAALRTTLASEGIVFTPSRLDGRSKGTVLLLTGPDRARLNHVAATLRTLRAPDPYKGKGIQYDKEVILLKKGKREG